MLEFLIMQLIYPPIMGYLATTKDYRYWTWAIIGFFVPVVSIFILFALKKRPIKIDASKIVTYECKDKVLFRKDELFV